MTDADAVALIAGGIKQKKSSSIWADLGCGTGTFTQALCELLETGSTVYAVDRTKVLNIEPAHHDAKVLFIKRDFVLEKLPFTDLDGILLANSLHFVEAKEKLIQKLSSHLKSMGSFLVVEYDTAKSNQWIPYPIPFAVLGDIFSGAGFSKIEKIGERDSVYHVERMYAALIQR